MYLIMLARLYLSGHLTKNGGKSKNLCTIGSSSLFIFSCVSL